MPLFALTFIIGAFSCGGAAAYAYAADDPPESAAAAETPVVDEIWLTGDTLHITVADKESAETQTLEMSLSDYAQPGDEYVTVQATDSAGRASNSVKFKNPYYLPDDVEDQATPAAEAGGYGEPEDGKTSESAVRDGANPFTPDGTGSVVDNATDGGGKEFFTVETADGNVFYLIVDRRRADDNVYLLNAVTEDDLGSLAKPGDGKNVSAVETPPAASTEPAPAASAAPEPTPEPAPENNGSGGASMYILIAVATLAAGGAGYYLKIVRPKKSGAEDDADDFDEPEDEDNSFDDDEELDFGDSESPRNESSWDEGDEGGDGR
jgi:hypothetical protein